MLPEHAEAFDRAEADGHSDSIDYSTGYHGTQPAVLYWCCRVSIWQAVERAKG